MNHLRTTELPAVFASRDLPQGISRKVLYRKGIVPITQGVYRRTDQEYNYQQLAVAVHRSIPGSVLSGLTAAFLHGMRVDVPEKIYLASPQRVRRDLIVHSCSTIASEEIWQAGGCLLTSPQRTFLDCGTYLAVRDLVKVADGLVNHHAHRTSKAPEYTVGSLQTYLANQSGTKGVVNCRKALELSAVGADSPQETQMRLVLQEHGITGLVPNPPVRNEWGWVMFEPDLADFEYRLSIQYEGAHHGSAYQLRKDEDRLRKTQELGWSEVKVFASDLKEFVYWDGAFVPRLVAKVKEARARRRPAL